MPALIRRRVNRKHRVHVAGAGFVRPRWSSVPNLKLHSPVLGLVWLDLGPQTAVRPPVFAAAGSDGAVELEFGVLPDVLEPIESNVGI